MSKKLSKKFLSCVAASAMIFSSTPKNNAKACGVLLIGVGAVAVLAVGLVFLVGKFLIEASKEYEEKMNKRQESIDDSDVYIKKLAQNLKEIIYDDELFAALVKCKNEKNLRDWQNKVLNSNLSENDLNKIIINLRNHWRDCYIKLNHDCCDVSVEKQTESEIQVLRDKYDALVEKNRHEEQMRIEKEKLQILKEQNRIEKERLQIEREKLKNNKNLAFQ